MASPIPATAYQGLGRPQGSQLLELWLPQASPNHENGSKSDANSGTIYEISVGDNIGAYLGSSRGQKDTRYRKVQKNTRKVRNGRPTGTPF